MNYASPQTVADARAVGTITPGYMTGFGNSFETEALPGALPIGRNSPQKMLLWTLRGAALRLAFYRAARGKRALLALPDWPSVKHSGRFEKIDIGLMEDGALCGGGHSDRPIALGPDADCRTSRNRSSKACAR